MAPVERVKTAFRRSGYLFFLAFAFRLQLWIFGFPAPGGIFSASTFELHGVRHSGALGDGAVSHRRPRQGGRGGRSGDRLRLAAGFAVALGGGAWLVRNYIAPDYHFFGFFPWGAYLAFGVSAGSVIRSIPADATDRVMQWAAMLGGAMILVCHYVDACPTPSTPRRNTG